jgi:hypothetical protein
MSPTRSTILPRWLSLILLVTLSLVGFLALRHLLPAAGLGKRDFIGYWSATTLVQRGQNPYDGGLMDNLQHVELVSDIEPTIMAWNPPTVFVFLLPLTWLSFPTATFVWLVLSTIILLGGSLTLARIYLPSDSQKFILLFLLFVIVFPQTLSGLYMGQVTFLVFLGLAGCLACIRKGRWFWAGACLMLTTVKPHLVVLPLIYLLLYMLLERRCDGPLGLAAAGAGCAGVLFLFRPEWVQDLVGLLAIAPVNWATTTIGGLLSYWQVSEAGRSLIMLLLPLPVLLLRYRSKIGVDLAVALLTLITVPTTFFGWGYDQIMLFFPVAQVFGWLARLQNRTLNACIAAAVSLALAVNYVQRAVSENEAYYLWVPLFWWVVFGLSWLYFSRSAPASAQFIRPVGEDLRSTMRVTQ